MVETVFQKLRLPCTPIFGSKNLFDNLLTIWYLYLFISQKPLNFCFDMIKPSQMDTDFLCDDIFYWEYFFYKLFECKFIIRFIHDAIFFWLVC